MINFKFLIILKCVIILLLSLYSPASASNKKMEALAISYANLVNHYYNEVAIKTETLHKSINIFLESPNAANLSNAKNKWIEARKVYGITEAFRFYGGPN